KLRPRARPLDNRHAMSAPTLEAKTLFRKIEAMCADLGAAGPGKAFSERFTRRLVDELGDVMDIRATQLYETRDGDLALRKSWGDAIDGLGPELKAMIGRSIGGADAGWPWVGVTSAGPTGVIALEHRTSWLIAMLFRGDESSSATDMLS